MHRFDYSEILGDIPSDIVSLMLEIARVQGAEGIRRSNYRSDYRRLEDIARVASVKYSNAIEGIYTTDERIEEMVLRGGTPRNHSEKEIAGYKEVLDRIHSQHESIAFDRETILSIHGPLSSDGSDGRSFKDRDNAIISVDSQGKRHITYEPVPASETEEHMEQLILAYDELSTQGYEPLLYIPCIILDFLCIHPFTDGNGRTSRLLTVLLLHKEGIDVCRYISMDEHIAATKDRYYRALEESSFGWRENRWSYFPFIRYFLQTLLECYIDLDTRFSIVDGRKLDRKQTVEDVIRKSIVPVSKAQIKAVLKDVSVYTIEKSLKQLLADGTIERIGETKAARYRIKRRTDTGVRYIYGLRIA